MFRFLYLGTLLESYKLCISRHIVFLAALLSRSQKGDLQLDPAIPASFCASRILRRRHPFL